MMSGFTQLFPYSLANPSAVALIGEGREYSFEHLRSESLSVAAGLQADGVKPGDRVAIELPNGVDFVLCYLACLLGGFTAVPVNRALPEADIRYILDLTRPAVHLTDARPLPRGEWTGEIVPHTDHTLLIAFTSGTTSRPKGVCHSAEALLTNADAFNRLVGLDAQSRLYHVMPMGYMAGFLNTVLCPLLAGGSVVLGPQFDAAQALTFWTPFMQHQANGLWLTPTMAALVTRLCRDARITEWTRANLRHVFVGTAPLPEVVAQGFEARFGVPCLESYGMTEVLLTAANTPEGLTRGSVGELLDSVQVEARDDQGRSLPPGQEGELFVHSPYLLQGYLEADGKTLWHPQEEGWLPTGDIGRLDAHKRLFITGRKKDLIIHGGTNVSPRAVEEVLLMFPGIQDAAVVGAPHPFWGEEVVAFYIAAPGAEIDLNQLKQYCQQHLAPDAVPSQFRPQAEFPRSSTGKIQKHQLKDAGLAA